MDRSESETETEETVTRHEPHDSWPIDGYEGPDREPTYIGIMNPGQKEKEQAVLYDDYEGTVFRADIDEDDQQLIPQAETEQEVGPTESLGETLEEFGDRLDWDSLSAFARDRLQDDEPADADAETVNLSAVTFTQSNTDTDASHELEFSGSYRYTTDDGRELSVQRTFEVVFDDPAEPRRATVDVIERVMRTGEAADPSPGEDAEQLDERETTFEIDLDARTTDRQTEAYVEDQCEEWHETQVEPPL